MNKVFQNAVERVSTANYLSNKSSIVEYYRDTYGEKKWKREAAIAMSGTADSKSRAYQSAMRNFQGKRLQESGDTRKWKELGKQLPPVSRTPKTESITITVKGTQDNGRGGTRDRAITVTFSGSQAYSWVNEPNFSDIWDEYGFDFDGEEDGDYALQNVSVS